MDLVFGKCAQTGLLAFLIGAGFPVWQHAGDRARALGLAKTAPQHTGLPPLRSVLSEAVVEGLRTSRVLVAATAASGTASFLQHGRYSERLFRLRGDPLSTFSGVLAAVYFWLPSEGVGGGGGAGPKLSPPPPSPFPPLKGAGGHPAALPAAAAGAGGTPMQRFGTAFLIACISGAVSGAMGR